MDSFGMTFWSDTTLIVFALTIGSTLLLYLIELDKVNVRRALNSRVEEFYHGFVYKDFAMFTVRRSDAGRSSLKMLGNLNGKMKPGIYSLDFLVLLYEDKRTKPIVRKQDYQSA